MTATPTSVKLPNPAAQAPVTTPAPDVPARAVYHHGLMRVLKTALGTAALALLLHLVQSVSGDAFPSLLGEIAETVVGIFACIALAALYGLHVFSRLARDAVRAQERRR